ncbi:MAG: helix-turn-helix domain-containing protein, partial [Trebonia sp.]
MEYREAELREVVPSGVPDDDPVRFLRELRQLRNGAGLEHVELAARAHYPCDAILAAEAGPALPDLPVLSAYVRGCGGTVTDWEERWRTLTRSPALTLLPTRDAGGSDAAAAGARIGSVSLAADAHDPAIIMAALGRVA